MKEAVFEELITIMNDIYKVQEKLYQLGEEKTEAIINQNIENLEAISKNEAELISLTNKLEESRDELLNDYDNISEIIADLDSKRAENLNDLRQKIFAKIEDLAYLNQNNNKLLKNALQLNEFTLNLLNNQQRHATYGKSGQDNENEQKSFINHKA